MCQSYKKQCVCNQKTAEIFFGKMLLDEKSVAELYCPECSQGVDTKCDHRVWDNDWVLELDMDVMLNEFYTVSKWDRETGKPTKEKLMELGLQKVAEDLYG
jgi:hypothetical protein